MEGPPLGPGGEDIPWPAQVAPLGRKASSTRKIKHQTSNMKRAHHPSPVTGPLPASCGPPTPRGCCAAPFRRSSRVYTPPSRQQPLARALWILIHPGTVSCAQHWSLPSRPRPSPLRRVPSPTSVFSPSCVFPVSLGLSRDPSHTPFSAPSPYPSIPCFYPTGPPATLWRGPTGSASCLGLARATSTVRSLPVPFRCGKGEQGME